MLITTPLSKRLISDRSHLFHSLQLEIIAIAKIIVSSGRLDPQLLQEVGDLNILGSAIALFE
ncbi:hypothetical protein [Nostoc sp.]|uniref:hypothetical protein n=1 Tax=Nostoc sp. TaxID=1180 RepID=UPI002FF68104